MEWTAKCNHRDLRSALIRISFSVVTNIIIYRLSGENRTITIRNRSAVFFQPVCVIMTSIRSVTWAIINRRCAIRRDSFSLDGRAHKHAARTDKKRENQNKKPKTRKRKAEKKTNLRYTRVNTMAGCEHLLGCRS